MRYVRAVSYKMQSKTVLATKLPAILSLDIYKPMKFPLQQLLFEQTKMPVQQTKMVLQVTLQLQKK